MELEMKEMQRFGKQMLLPDIGMQGQLLLKQSKVAVIGAGGLGCPILQYLNAVGIGTLGIIDFDVIALSNLHRQVLYTPADVGKKKAHTATEKLSLQNPHTQFVVIDQAIEKSNAMRLLKDFDIVVDGCDNFNTRYIVNDACVALDKPLVYGSILGYEGQVAVFNHKGSKNLRDVFPEPPNPDEVPDCSENGVLGTVPGIIGLMMAQAAISLVLGKDDYRNKFVIFDTLKMDKTTLVIS